MPLLINLFVVSAINGFIIGLGSKLFVDRCLLSTLGFVGCDDGCDNLFFFFSSFSSSFFSFFFCSVIFFSASDFNFTCSVIFFSASDFNFTSSATEPLFGSKLARFINGLNVSCFSPPYLSVLILRFTLLLRFFNERLFIFFFLK